jgi:HSP20 family protein
MPERERFSMSDTKKGTEFELNVGFGNIFKGIGNLFDLLSEMAETGEEEVKRTKKFGGEGKWKDLQGVYGFSIRVGADRKARVEPFGNIRDTKGGPVVEEVREPMADVFDEGDTIQVICELPGVAAEEIKVEVQGDILEIAAEGKQRKYRKEILLAASVKPESLVTAYKNGVLEIGLTKVTEKAE